MRALASTLFGLLALSLPGTTLAQSRIEYINTDDYFGINFPAEPEIETFSYDSEFGAVFPGRRFSVEAGANRYVLSVVDFTNSQAIHAAIEKTAAAGGPSNWLYDQRASVARAAREFRARGGEVTYDAWSHLDRVEGHQLQLTNPDGTRTYAGMYLNSNRHRLYVVEATVTPNSPPPIQFQQSLHFLDDEGDKIRYRLSTNGCAVDPDAPRIEMLSIR